MDRAQVVSLVGDRDVDPLTFEIITAKMFYDISPFDQDTWSLILNEEREDNLIHTWAIVTKLEQEGKWEEIATLYKLNKQRFNKMRTLNNLKKPDVWVNAFKAGKVTEATVFQVAKMGGRQDFLEDLLSKKGKVTSKDVADTKSVSVSAAVNLPFLPKTVVSTVSEMTLFVTYRVTTNEVGKIGTFTECLEKQRELGGDFILYKMVPVKT
jgi:hypothetical protein